MKLLFKKICSHFPAINSLKTCTSPGNRGTWGRKYIGTLAVLGLTIGSGDFMYFPGWIAKYNLVFLVPYVTVLFFIGIPLFAFEMALGQYLSVGPIKAFGRLAPILSGFGTGMVLISLVTSIYYNYYLAITLVVLWRNLLFWTGKGHQTVDEEIMSDLCSFASNSSHSLSTREQPFFDELFTCFALSWLIVGLCLIRGYHASSKLIIISQMIPFFLLSVLVIIYISIELKFTRTPDVGTVSDQMSNVSLESYLADLFDSTIWYDALRHVLFSLAIGFGGIPTLASFNTLQHNFIWDSWLVPLANFITGGMYTLIITKHLPIDSDYSYLTVICTYSNVESIKPIAILVFLMFYLMCLTCQLIHVDTGVTAIFDIFNLPVNSRGRACIVLLVVIIGYLSGFCICLSYANYIIIRSFGRRILMTNIILEALATPFIFFKFDKIKTQLHLNIFECVENHLLICWIFIAPVLIWVIIIWSYLACGLSSPTESETTVIVTTLIYLILISAITIIRCWNLEKSVFSPKETFCTYPERIAPPAYTLPACPIPDLPESPPNTPRRPCDTGRITSIELLSQGVESTYL